MPEANPSPAPSGRFLSAEWRTLVMLNWEVDPAVLHPFVPRGTELDSWQGKTFVSAVGFLFLDTRLFGFPIPFHRDFEEVNLRFYVGRQGPEGWRRGVCFIREIVPKWAVAFLARAVYNERYVSLPMRHRVQPPSASTSGSVAGSSIDGSSGRGTPGVAEYAWKHGGRWNSLHAQFSGEAQPLVAGSVEEFITEHYWGYAAQRDGGTVEYRVEHPSWNVWRADEAVLDADVAALYGAEFVAPLSAPPSSAFVADGSPVVVRRARRIA